MSTEELVRSKTKVGIVGLGDQGTPIALCLIKAGWPLFLHARRPEVCDRFVQCGATYVPLLALGCHCDIVLVVVGNEQQVRDVVLTGGLLDQMRPGSILVIHSSIPPDAVRGIHAIAESHAVHLLDAPVSGGRDRSYAGDLTILVGGDAAVMQAALPILSAYGSKVVRMGPVGSGQLAKCLNNYFYAAHLATSTKMIELITSFGLDVDAAADALPTCSGSSAAFAIQARRKFKRTQHDKSAAHALSLLTDVVEGLRALAMEAGVELGLVDQLVEDALAMEQARAGEDIAPRA